jgi:hypothetical protein
MGNDEPKISMYSAVRLESRRRPFGFPPDSSNLRSEQEGSP